MSFATSGVAVAVSARKGTPGRISLMSAIDLYSGVFSFVKNKKISGRIAPYTPKILLDRLNLLLHALVLVVKFVIMTVVSLKSEEILHFVLVKIYTTGVAVKIFVIDVVFTAVTAGDGFLRVF